MVDPADGPLVAGGLVVGAFDYTSSGDTGWSVRLQRNFGGLTPDAVTQARGLVVGLPWWADPAIPLHAGYDVLERPRRLAWLASGNTPRRFLIHTIHAERDASNRPGNNYSECLVVAPLRGEPAVAASDERDRIRPTQLWDTASWSTPWGAEEVSRAVPGQRWHHVTHQTGEIFDQIVGAPAGLAQLRRMLRAVHDVAHLRRGRLIGHVDDFIWAVGLLDVVLSLLPEQTAWDLTFDIRSIAPRGSLGSPLAQGLNADLNLFGPEFPSSHRTRDAVDLTQDGAEQGSSGAWTSDASPPGSPCPVCHRWFATIEALLARSQVTAADLAVTLNTLRASHQTRLALVDAALAVQREAQRAVAAQRQAEAELQQRQAEARLQAQAHMQAQAQAQRLAEQERRDAQRSATSTPAPPDVTSPPSRAGVYLPESRRRAASAGVPQLGQGAWSDPSGLSGQGQRSGATSPSATSPPATSPLAERHGSAAPTPKYDADVAALQELVYEIQACIRQLQEEDLVAWARPKIILKAWRDIEAEAAANLAAIRARIGINPGGGQADGAPDHGRHGRRRG